VVLGRRAPEVHHERAEAKGLPERKLAAFWILGALAISFGAWILGNVEFVLGASTVSVTAAAVFAFILILLGGLAWIAVAIAVAHHR